MRVESQLQLFFASVTEFVTNFDYNDSYESIIINLTNTHIWDDSAVGAIDKIVLKYRKKNKHVKIVGLNQPSSALMDKLAVHNK
ncbi:STAS domain-containing protein [Heyndrickxia sp. FSL W8-0496]|jgi:SulP family sulfate permease|uniref:STAS domain-containing protein n=1 Tax=Heyndrickxia TaxID=2837504 RepID=UPI0030F89588